MVQYTREQYESKIVADFHFCTQTSGECNFALAHTSESVNLYYQMEVQICTQADA